MYIQLLDNVVYRCLQLVFRSNISATCSAEAMGEAPEARICRQESHGAGYGKLGGSLNIGISNWLVNYSWKVN